MGNGAGRGSAGAWRHRSGPPAPPCGGADAPRALLPSGSVVGIGIGIEFSPPQPVADADRRPVPRRFLPTLHREAAPGHASTERGAPEAAVGRGGIDSDSDPDPDGRPAPSPNLDCGGKAKRRHRFGRDEAAPAADRRRLRNPDVPRLPPEGLATSRPGATGESPSRFAGPHAGACGSGTLPPSGEPRYARKAGGRRCHWRRRHAPTPGSSTRRAPRPKRRGADASRRTPQGAAPNTPRAVEG